MRALKESSQISEEVSKNEINIYIKMAYKFLEDKGIQFDQIELF
jgi:hypothetical protein